MNNEFLLDLVLGRLHKLKKEKFGNIYNDMVSLSDIETDVIDKLRQELKEGKI